MSRKKIKAAQWGRMKIKEAQWDEEAWSRQFSHAIRWDDRAAPERVVSIPLQTVAKIMGLTAEECEAKMSCDPHRFKSMTLGDEYHVGRTYKPPIQKGGKWKTEVFTQEQLEARVNQAWEEGRTYGWHECVASASSTAQTSESSCRMYQRGFDTGMHSGLAAARDWGSGNAMGRACIQDWQHPKGGPPRYAPY